MRKKEVRKEEDEEKRKKEMRKTLFYCLSELSCGGHEHAIEIINRANERNRKMNDIHMKMNEF